MSEEPKLTRTTKTLEKNECDRPCGTCPFLKKNLHRANPPGFEVLKSNAAVEGIASPNWYEEKNLVRIWRDGLRKGEAMLCHSSDPNAADYGGQNAKPGDEKLCTGSLILVFGHLKYLEKLIKKGLSAQAVQKEYRLNAGKYPLTKSGQAIWAWAFATGHQSGLRLKLTVDSRYFEEVGVPWKDFITDNGAANFLPSPGLFDKQG